MAGNRRGKLKEELEGIHRDYDWVIAHCQKAIALIGDDNPGLTSFFESVMAEAKAMDEAAMEVYSTI